MILSGGTAKLSGIDEWIASQIGVPVLWRMNRKM